MATTPGLNVGKDEHLNHSDAGTTPVSHESHDGAHRGPAPRQELEPKSTEKKKLPPFLDHFNARDLKILFRCSVALWTASILVFINPTLQTFGQATFFATIAVLFLPPSGVVLVFLLGGFTEILGMALGWCWGVIAQKVALATRPASETLARERLLIQQAQATGTSVSILIFDGFMLDTRVTVTYFCMLGIFIYFMARLRLKVPKLTLTVVMSWIITDVFLTNGPLLPTFNGTLPTVLIEPAAAALAISLACALLIFPESTSHLTLYGMHELAESMSITLSLTSQTLAQYPVDNSEALQGLKTSLIGGWTALEPAIAFLPFDLSFGYWNSQDITSLRTPLRQLLLHIVALLDFEILQCQSRNKFNNALFSEKEEKQFEEANEFGKHQVMQNLNLLATMRQPEVTRSVQQSYEALNSASDPLLKACQQAMKALLESLHENNSRPWFGKTSLDDIHAMRHRHEIALEGLKEQHGRYPQAANSALLDAHKHLFDESGFLLDTASSRPKLAGLFIGFNFEDRLVRLAEAIERPLAQVVLLEGERTSRRVWFPTSIRKFFAWVFGRTPTPVPQMTSTEFPEVDKATIEEVQVKLRGKSRPVKRRNRISAIILGFAHWLSNEEGVFAFRVVVASLAVSVVAVTTNTAGFFYREKGLWAVIMAQTGLLPHFSDFTFSLVMRLVGTVCGGALGMVGWYIGSGNGLGNPYGLAAVMAVYSPLLMWCRLYAPPQHMQTTIISGATVMLVIGYSYNDTHNPTYGNPGVGYEIFWRRTLLVLIGFAVGTIVSLFPWPISTSRYVSKALAQVLHAEADHYALLLTEWHELDDEKRLLPAIGGSAIHLAETLGSLQAPIANLPYEFSSSPFDRASCGKVLRLCGLINAFLTSLHFRASMLPLGYRTRLARASGLLDHRSIGDVMAVMAVVEQALKTGDPLPSRLPTPLLVKCLDFGHASNVDTISIKTLDDVDYRGYCVSMSAYLGFLSAADELVLVLKEALGESHHVPEHLTDLE